MKIKKMSKSGSCALAAILCLGACGIFTKIYFDQCFLWTCPPKRNFSIMDTTIPKSYYPANVAVGSLREYDIRDTIRDDEHGSMTVGVECMLSM